MLLQQSHGLQILVVEEGIEAGTDLHPLPGLYLAVAVQVGRQVAMAQNDGRRILFVQTAEQGAQALALLHSARVGGQTEQTESTLVADADGVSVVPQAVSPLLPYGSPLMYLSVARDVVVIADVLVAPGAMVLATLLERVASVRPGGGAMDDDECDGAHGEGLII